MRVSEDIIQKIKDKVNIVEIISETVKLKKSGNNYTGLCPFHNEKTPSFIVSPDRQTFKCFGCGEAGNVFTFIMKTRNLLFPEVVKLLADKAGIIVEESSKEEKAKKDYREKLLLINVEAARYFFSNLKSNPISKKYFLNRGITETTIRKFGLGYSKDSFNSLLNYLKNKGFTELDLINAGLIKKSENHNLYYDRFRNRVMFPVFDYSGKVIGFGGRVLDDSRPKYLNSPETVLFNKGTNLYGLNFAVKEHKDRTFVIVEGYMDCIALHQYGITNVVASLGTALTPSQAKLLKRYADKVIISYDADIAGQNATIKGMEILKNEGFDVRVLTVPQGKDPDEYIRNFGKEAFLRLMEESLPLIDYRIKKAAEGINFSDQEMLIIYARRITDILIDLNPVEKDVYIKRVSEQTNIKEQALYDLLTGEMQKNVNKLQNMNTNGYIGQKLYLEQAYIKAERYLLKLMLDDENNLQKIINNIKEEEFVLDSHKKIYRLILEADEEDRDKLIQKLEIQCDDVDSSKEFVIITNLDLFKGDIDYDKLINDYTREIKKFKLEEVKKTLISKIKINESKGLIEESVKLAQELMKIQKEIGRL